MFSSRKQVLAAAGLVVAGGFAFYFWQSSKLKRLAVEPQRIAVLRFENQTTDPELDPLGAALALSLADRVAALDRTEAFIVSTAGEAAGRRATLLIHGRIEEERGQYRLSVSLERLASREFEGAGSAAGPRERIPTLLDTIAEGVRSAVRPKGTLAKPEFRTLAAALGLGRSMETAALEASTAELQKAVEAEPSCGSCWRRLVEINLAGGARDRALAFAQTSRDKKISAYSLAAIDLAVAAAAGDRQGQSKALERLAAIRPGDYEFQARLGNIQASLGRWQTAVASYRRAVESAPYEAGLWNEFGYALAWAGQSDEAMRALNEYARLDPGSPNPQDSLGEVALMNGRFDDAINRFEESYKKDKGFNNGQAIEKAGLAAYLAGDKARAASYIDRYMAGLGNVAKPTVTLLRAQWQYALGATGGAAASLESLDPAAAALALAASGDWKSAEQMLASRPNQGAPRIRIVLAGEGRLPAELAERKELAPVRGMSAALRGRWPEAAQEFTRALGQIPANEPHATLLREAAAWALVMDGKTDEAARLVGPQWPLPMPPGFNEISLLVYPNLFYTRAEIALSQGRRDEARKMYDHFLMYSGDRKDPYGMIARARAAARL